jgi:hypothetical protein
MALRRSDVTSNALVLAAGIGPNSAAIRDAAELYIRDRAIVADVTYGRGAFWTETDTTRFKFLKSDLNPASRDVRVADLRRLPYDNCSVDVLVLDPPYAQNIHDHALASWYNRGSPAMTATDRCELYRGGMREAARVLRPGGTLWVKTKDQVEREGQHWRHIKIYQDAIALGFGGRDLFVVLTAPPILGRWNTQKHARKNYSFLWIFQKETARIASLMGFPRQARRRRFVFRRHRSV